MKQRHLLSHGTTAIDSVGIEFYSHRLGVESVETNLNLKYVLIPFGFQIHLTEEFATLKNAPIVEAVISHST